MTVTIRDAARGDVPLILKFVTDLAAYEKLSHEAKATEADLERELFGAAPRVFCQIAEHEGAPAGFALWFYTFSTFEGRHGIWLEDLFVNPEMRGHGIGKALLIDLARRCVREGLGRFEWAVLDWNQPSIDFYAAQGATFMDDWRRCRVTGEALHKLGAA
ncbi:MAG: GNAT family N-acetyltransferase [Devosia nanyangense]|uniref:GNAT family N-acetyltransferase n=1 Tax=Devosia nanyangense TaxID=1228055 RepID=A0A933NZV8_9HYPH|nr:GNAT family N-acetyltransferase [Devosia nanyangense]